MKYKIKEFMKADISRFYILGVGIICLLLLGGYFSYAMFTVSKEKENAITIETGGLNYKLQVNGEDINTLTVDANTTSTFTITLSNINNRVARFNFYYEGSLPTGVTAGYLTGDGLNTPPEEKGINLEKADASGSSNIYNIRVRNSSNSRVTITIGAQVGLDYNDLTLPENGHLFEEMITTGPVADIVIENLNGGDTYDDGTDTFITGTEPNNYIWYSGKLWRAVSVNNVNNEAKTTKLVTQWNISAINYSSGSTAFEDSFVKDWLNDTSVDGFLGNLRDYENFIVTDATWDATMDDTELGSIQRPDGTSVSTSAVGLLNIYEYQSSYHGTTAMQGYLNNSLFWWTLTPYSNSYLRDIRTIGTDYNDNPANIPYGVRPSINLKSTVKIISGDGTIDNPYRLEGDNDTDLSGTMLSTRYSGEYLTFGTGENTLYRIVSHENGTGTKIISAEPLRDNGTFIKTGFGSNVTYSNTNTIGKFLNEDYLTNYVGNTYNSMIEDNTTWYLGTVENGDSYKLAKYTDTNMSETAKSTDAKVGLLRYGELMSGQFINFMDADGTSYWTLTPATSSAMRYLLFSSSAPPISPSTNEFGVVPSMNLKSNVVITGGTGTKLDPFTIELAS